MPSKKRSSSAPPRDRPTAPSTPGAADAALTLDGELEPLPLGRGYESADEDDGPAMVLEDADLIGHAERAAAIDADGSPAARTTVSDSPTRAREVATGADGAKKQTAANERKKADDDKWTALATDSSCKETFPRPSFAPFKADNAPAGFRQTADHDEGGPHPHAALTSSDHPVKFVSAMGFDVQLFQQFRTATNRPLRYIVRIMNASHFKIRLRSTVRIMNASRFKIRLRSTDTN
jgi:hypothetical protein